MNLEELISRSASPQASRYRQAANLTQRIEQRRRQRVARRWAAATIACSALFIGLAVFAMTQFAERRAVTPAEPGATITAPSTIVPTTAAPTTVTTSTPVSTTSTASSTTQSPAAAAQPTSPPTTPPLHPSTPGAHASADGSVWPFGEFWNAPQLGHETVRGTGCGSSQTISEVIPDGLWAAFVIGHTDTTVALDLLCVFSVANAAALPNPASNVVLDQPAYVVVNNSTRARTMPMHARIVLRLGARDGSGRCVDGTSTSQWSDIVPDRQVWVRIHEGRITWVFAGCPSG